MAGAFCSAPVVVAPGRDKSCTSVQGLRPQVVLFTCRNTSPALRERVAGQCHQNGAGQGCDRALQTRCACRGCWPSPGSMMRYRQRLAILMHVGIHHEGAAAECRATVRPVHWIKARRCIDTGPCVGWVGLYDGVGAHGLQAEHVDQWGYLHQSGAA